MSEFKKLTIGDIELIRKYLSYTSFQSCDYSAANIILWSEVYNTEYILVEDMLIMKFRSNDKIQFTFPLGKNNLKKAFEWIMDYCYKNNIPFQINPVEPSMFELIEQLYPGKYMIQYNRDNYDYVYSREALKELSGKKYHGKKNHINKFKKINPEWAYEDISFENKEECIEMVKKWCVLNDCGDDEEKVAEICVVIKAIKYMEELNLIGGVVRTREGIVALTMGEAINDDTFIIHFEKAFASIQGSYTMINQQFIENRLINFNFINREEDMGIEGLRKAKESYHPLYLIEKGTVKEKK